VGSSGDEMDSMRNIDRPLFDAKPKYKNDSKEAPKKSIFLSDKKK